MMTANQIVIPLYHRSIQMKKVRRSVLTLQDVFQKDLYSTKLAGVSQLLFKTRNYVSKVGKAGKIASEGCKPLQLGLWGLAMSVPNGVQW